MIDSSSTENLAVPVNDKFPEDVGNTNPKNDEEVSFPAEHPTGSNQHNKRSTLAVNDDGDTMKDLARWFQEEYATSNACVALEQDKWARELC